jgi:hypothetical protein
VTRSAVGVIIYKKVGNRYLEKRVNVRVEHINHSRSRDECKIDSYDPPPHDQNKALTFVCAIKQS